MKNTNNLCWSRHQPVLQSIRSFIKEQWRSVSNLCFATDTSSQFEIYLWDLVNFIIISWSCRDIAFCPQSPLSHYIHLPEAGDWSSRMEWAKGHHKDHLIWYRQEHHPYYPQCHEHHNCRFSFHGCNSLCLFGPMLHHMIGESNTTRKCSQHVENQSFKWYSNGTWPFQSWIKSDSIKTESDQHVSLLVHNVHSTAAMWSDKSLRSDRTQSTRVTASPSCHFVLTQSHNSGA